MNHTLRIPATLALIVLFALGLSNCSKETPAEPATSAVPLTELDRMINDYEQVVTDYVKTSKRHQAGDNGVTIKLMEDEDSITQMVAKLKQKAGEMDPAQAQRVAGISARKDVYMK